MNVLFVDSIHHKNTHSADFFLEILRNAFSVDMFYYDEYYDFQIPADKSGKADVVIFWEFLSHRFRLGLPGKPCIFVPMYDNEWGSKWQWRRLARSGMSVISFCEAVSRHAHTCGVKNLLDVRFAFNPSRYMGFEGDPRKVTLWDRGQITFSHLKRIFHPDQLDKVTIFRRPEPNVQHEDISPEDRANYHVEIKEGGYIPTDDYLSLQKESGIYLSPRWREGIGMTFLEQMAMGKCVIAHDAGTMNEYIQTGVNGILRNFRTDHSPVNSREIERIRGNARAAAQRAYERWLSDKEKIIPFIKAAARRPPLSVGSMTDRVQYGLFLIEGLLMRLRTHLPSS